MQCAIRDYTSELHNEHGDVPGSHTTWAQLGMTPMQRKMFMRNYAEQSGIALTPDNIIEIATGPKIVDTVKRFRMFMREKLSDDVSYE